jgi:hypothetical protein
MPTWVFYLIVVVFVVVAILIISRQIRGAIFERLPIEPDESILLEERGLKVFEKIREASGGKSLTSRVTVVLTNRRILVATGGPEGKHKFFLKMILDYKTPPPVTSDTGYSAYYEKFQLANGYATYYIAPSDVNLVEKKGELAVKIHVPFPEHGSMYVEPEVIIYTKNSAAYRLAFSLPLP